MMKRNLGTKGAREGDDKKIKMRREMESTKKRENWEQKRTAAMKEEALTFRGKTKTVENGLMGQELKMKDRLFLN